MPTVTRRLPEAPRLALQSQIWGRAVPVGRVLLGGGNQGVMRIATSYFVTEARSPGVSPAGIAFSTSSPRL
jgi:hypothetical protein